MCGIETNQKHQPARPRQSPRSSSCIWSIVCCGHVSPLVSDRRSELDWKESHLLGIVAGCAAVVDRPADDSTGFSTPFVGFFLTLSVRGGEECRYRESEDGVCEWPVRHGDRVEDCGVRACARVLAL